MSGIQVVLNTPILYVISKPIVTQEGIVEESQLLAYQESGDNFLQEDGTQVYQEGN